MAQCTHVTPLLCECTTFPYIFQMQFKVLVLRAYIFEKSSLPWYKLRQSHAYKYLMYRDSISSLLHYVPSGTVSTWKIECPQFCFK